MAPRRITSNNSELLLMQHHPPARLFSIKYHRRNLTCKNHCTLLPMAFWGHCQARLIPVKRGKDSCSLAQNTKSRCSQVSRKMVLHETSELSKTLLMALQQRPSKAANSTHFVICVYNRTDLWVCFQGGQSATEAARTDTTSQQGAAASFELRCYIK